MHEWSLGPGDPLVLRLVADFRLSKPDYVNDHIWELETAGGDPPALSLHTTFGLRTRSMRTFPRFILNDRAVSDPSVFDQPPRVRRFYPNYLTVQFSPFHELDVLSEYWVPDSHSIAGRFLVANRSEGSVNLHLELCGQLVPLIGASLTLRTIQSANVLTGRCADLAPVLLLLGGPRPGMGPYPALELDLKLEAGETRTVIWAQAALSEMRDSFELARKVVSRPWESEKVRIELVNEAQMLDIYTGDPDWDAAFSLSQKTAFSLFFGSSLHLPHPSFVVSREADQGYSPRGDGTDYPYLWSGQSPLDVFYMASLLPGIPDLAAGLVGNFIESRSSGGGIDWRPGLAGQRGRWLAPPLLATLALRTYQLTGDLEFLHDALPGLKSYLNCWFDRVHDRDADGLPEWDHPLQAGLEDILPYTVWLPGGQGADISSAESPALAALLYRENCALTQIAELLDMPDPVEGLKHSPDRLRALTEECWDDSASLYHTRDRYTHLSPRGKRLGGQRGTGTLELGKTLRQPVRLLVRVELKSEVTRRVEVSLRGQNGDLLQSENFSRTDFQWGAGLAVATSRLVYTDVDRVIASGLDKQDRVSVWVMDFSNEEISLFLPLWAGIPNRDRALKMVSQALLDADRFGRPYGIPLCSASRSAKNEPASCAVLMPWNLLVGEGLLGYGLREEAANLTGRLMAAVIRNLKQERAFAHAYHPETGAGLGPRNSLQGLAPLGLFLETLGLQVLSPERVLLSGKNPFPWPVTVKYRGLTVIRQADQTVIDFPDGQRITLADPTDALVSAD